jgi:hypothetical protein
MSITRRDALKGLGALTIGARFGGASLDGSPLDIAAIERGRVICASGSPSRIRR